MSKRRPYVSRRTVKIATTSHSALFAASVIRGIGVGELAESLIAAGLGLEPPPPPAREPAQEPIAGSEPGDYRPIAFNPDHLPRRGQKAIRPVLDGLTFNVPINLHERISAVAQARGVKIGSLAAEFLLHGLGLLPAPEPLPAVVPESTGRTKCARCERPAAVCPDCLREAEDVAPSSRTGSITRSRKRASGSSRAGGPNP